MALFGLALLWLHHVIGQYRWQDILAHMRAIRSSQLGSAVLLTAAGYGVLTLYDALGLKFAGAKLPYHRLALVSFMGYAIGHNVGANTLSGGAIRFRAYSMLGLSPKQIATVVAFGTFTFALGSAALLGVSLLSEAALSGSVLHMHRSLIVLGGCGLLIGVTAYLTLTFSRQEPLRWRKIVIPVPSPRIAFAQIAVASGDLLCAAGVLFSLLPAQAHIGFLAFAAIFIIAIAAGIISNVPGGVGVFESVLLLLFQSVPADALLGALLAYRIIYYLIPFGAALALLGAHELWAHRGPMVRIGHLARTWLSALTPQASALAVFGAGAVLLFSGSTPTLVSRVEWLRHVVPLPLFELSHLLGSVVGMGLLVLAHGLYRRLDAAWYLTMWLLCAGILLSLLKGFDYEDAIILGAVAVGLLSARSRFRRRASLIEQRFSLSWVIAVVLVLGAAGWLMFFDYRHVPYSKDLWWEFAFDSPAPRSLRALLLAAMIAAAFALWRLLRPSKPPILPPSTADLERAAALIENAHDASANLAVLGDKNLLFNPERTAFIMYQASGSSWVSMGDPVGPPALYEPLVWTFIENCDGMAVDPVFYLITPNNLPLYIDLGLTLSKLGEEARVPLDNFSLEGAARADLRHPHRRAQKDGAVFEVVPRSETRALMPELRAVSDAWLAAKNTAEKRFSLGYFDEAYLSHFDIAVVRRAGAIVAFANILRAGADTELSVDLMRYNLAAPKGVIDFLLVECMLWGKAQHYQWFSLGMAPLSGLEEHALAPAWHKLGRMVQRYGETFYPFEGLRKFKEKYLPVWRPRYLAAPGGLGMAGALLDVTSLISGGVTKVLTK
ncbi:MAG TPA: bifunctional lysylphosphatidylglycerol flippase/synthetase MprF [Steroidobacteraceae bacterium]|jgi:phosphatidylglycerol lysyltransferase|nr:bifunctional lysylphosphatidylglycerol flippase/synthetase MprF [Steroidobacteraceae bacterium]